MIALYEVTVKDLAFFKKQQWTVANYALLLGAAIVTVLLSMKEPRVGERLLGVVLAAAVGVLGCWIVHDLPRVPQALGSTGRLAADRRAGLGANAMRVVDSPAEQRRGRATYGFSGVSMPNRNLSKDELEQARQLLT